MYMLVKKDKEKALQLLKDGKIIEQGNHEVLMKKEGFYHHLYESQFSM